MKNDPNLLAKARELRKNLTPAEERLWFHLRDRRFAGLKFRRQQTIGAFIVDFFCSKVKLVIELDGETHLGNEAKDTHRDGWLSQQGYRVLRYYNTQVFDELDAVLEDIWRACEEATRGDVTSA